MGYSIYVAARSERAYERMSIFLSKNYKPLFSGDRAEQIASLSGLSYCESRLKYPIGFNYSSWVSGETRTYIHEVVYWMSRKLTAAPYTYYYDHECTKTPPERDEAELLAYLGEWTSWWGTPKKSIKAIYHAVQLLDALWEERKE